MSVQDMYNTVNRQLTLVPACDETDFAKTILGVLCEMASRYIQESNDEGEQQLMHKLQALPPVDPKDMN